MPVLPPPDALLPSAASRACAAASAAPSGTGAKEYNKLRRIIDEQGGHIEEAMDGVESAASKVEALETEVKDVWHKFPPAFEDMRKKQGGLQGDFDVLNKSTALLRLEHDRNFVSHEALHGASKQMKSDLQHTMDKVAALEVAKMGVRLPPGVAARFVRSAAPAGGSVEGTKKARRALQARNASQQQQQQQQREEEDGEKGHGRNLKERPGVTLSVDQGTTTLLNSGGLEVTNEFTSKGDAVIELSLIHI